MRKVLVISVGGSDRPIVNAIHQTKPDFVFFLCSAGEGPQASDRTITERIKTGQRRIDCPLCKGSFEQVLWAGPVAKEARLSNGDYEIESVEDPDSLDGVVEACERIADQIDRRFGEDTEVVANYTGGTKTMSVGLGLFVEAVRPSWQLHLNSAPRPDLNKVRMGDLSLRQRADRFNISQAREEAKKRFDAYEFEAARAVLEMTISEIGPSAARELDPLRLRCLAEAARDRFDHQSALELMGKASDGDTELKSHLRSVVRARELLEGKGPWHLRDVSGRELMRELLENARRCAARSRHDDAIGRLYRATELLGQLRLLRAYGVGPGRAEGLLEKVDPSTARWLEEQRSPEGGSIELGLIGGFELLDRLGDAIGREYRTRESDLRRWIELRNRSLFAHGLTPIDRDAWERAGKPWLDWLDDVSGSLREPPVGSFR